MAVQGPPAVCAGWRDLPLIPLPRARPGSLQTGTAADRKSTRLNSSHITISYAVFCLKKKKKDNRNIRPNTAGRNHRDTHNRTTALPHGDTTRPRTDNTTPSTSRHRADTQHTTTSPVL